jgi:hypothetical protein
MTQISRRSTTIFSAVLLVWTATGCGGHAVLAQFPNAATETAGQEVIWVERTGVLMRCYASAPQGSSQTTVPVCVTADYRRGESRQ